MRLRRLEPGMPWPPHSLSRWTYLTAPHAPTDDGIVARARREDGRGNARAAVTLARRAIELEPDKPNAYYVLGQAKTALGEWLPACDSFLEAEQRCESESRNWALAVCKAWGARKVAARCGTNNIFCDCDVCAVLPPRPVTRHEPCCVCAHVTTAGCRPTWMASKQALVAMAERVVAAAPRDAPAWELHARAHRQMGNPAAAEESCTRAWQLRGDEGKRLRAAAEEAKAKAAPLADGVVRAWCESDA